MAARNLSKPQSLVAAPNLLLLNDIRTSLDAPSNQSPTAYEIAHVGRQMRVLEILQDEFAYEPTTRSTSGNPEFFSYIKDAPRFRELSEKVHIKIEVTRQATTLYFMDQAGHPKFERHIFHGNAMLHFGDRKNILKIAE